MKNKHKISLRDFLFNLFLTIGIVIGVGIFFKNKSIIAAAHGNTSIVLTGWIIGGLISLSSAVAFSLLSFKLKKSDNNTAEFTKILFGNKAGNLVKWGNSLIYFPIYIYVIGLFSNMQLLDLFNVDHGASWYPFLLFGLTTTSIVLFILFNYFKEKASNIFHILTTIIKIIPFLFLSIIAFAVLFQTNTHSFWNGHPRVDIRTVDTSSYNQTSSMSSVAIVFWIIPAIKFAYDGFVSVTSNKRATSSRSLAWGITSGMIIVTIIFTLTAIAVLKEGVVSVPQAIVAFCGGNIHNMTIGYILLYKTIIFIIVLSGLSSMNGFIILWKRMSTQIKEDKKSNNKNSPLILMLVGVFYVTLPWVIVTLIIMIGHIGKIGNEGTAVLDEISNIVLLLHFVANAFILLKYLWLTFKKKTGLTWVFVIAAMIAIIGICITALWKIIDHIIIQTALYGGEMGIFGWYKWSYVLIFSFVVIQVMLAPLIGNMIFKTEKRKIYSEHKKEKF